MKKILTFLHGLILATSVYAQAEKKEIADIDSSVTTIKNKINTFRRIEKINTERGYRFVYIKDKELQLIAVKQVEPGVEKNVEWYYISGALVYSETNWYDTESKKILRHEKTYSKNGHLIAWIKPGNNLVDKTSSEFKTLDSALTTYGIQLKNAALK